MEMQKYIMQRDTNAWRMQVWLTFALAFTACAIGVLNLPTQEIDRAFLATGFFFCLFTTFALAKTVRDNRDGQVDTGAWIMAVWVAFAISLCLTAWGMWRMAVVDWQKGYVVVSGLFLVSSTFTLAKTVRDGHEAELMDRASQMAAPPPVPRPERVTASDKHAAA
jgi:hypothetical protein